MGGCISVIVPFFNVETYLGDCLRSLQIQSDADYEIILIDDGSTDGSPELAEAFRSNSDRCTLWRSSSNRGLGASRNKGVQLARGDFVCFVDADDVVSPDFLACLRDRQKITGASIVSGLIRRMTESGEVLDTRMIGDAPDVDPPLTVHERVLGLVNPSVACARLYRTGLLRDDACLFRDRIPHEDLFFTYKILRNRDTADAEEAVYFWRHREDSLSARITRAHVDVWLELKRDTDAFLTANQGSPREFALAARRSLMFVNGVLRKAEEQQRLDVLEYLEGLSQEFGSLMMQDYDFVRHSEIKAIYLPKRLEKYLNDLGFS